MSGRKKVTIVGGGQTGGIMAYRLAEKNICDIVIKDVAEFAQHHGKALDIYQGASVRRLRDEAHRHGRLGRHRRTPTSSSSPPARRASPA